MATVKKVRRTRAPAKPREVKAKKEVAFDPVAHERNKLMVRRQREIQSQIWRLNSVIDQTTEERDQLQIELDSLNE